MDQNLIEIKRLLDAGNRNEGIRLLSLLIRKNPNYVDAWLLLADTVKDPKKKLDCYKQILRLDPSNTIAGQKINSYLQTVEKLPTPRTNTIDALESHNSSKHISPTSKDAEGNKFVRYTIFIIIAIGVSIFAILGCYFLSSLFLKPTKPTQVATQTSIPIIHSSDLSSICIQNNELPIGYVATETIQNINETSHEENIKKGIEGYFEIKWEAKGYPSIVCQLLLYSSNSEASSSFQEMEKQMVNINFGEPFALQNYGDERIGILIPVDPLFYNYAYRHGRVIVNFYVLSSQSLEYAYIDKLVNPVETRLNQLNTR